jgi:hypothetical protein
MVKFWAGALVAAVLIAGGGVARAERPRVMVVPIAGDQVDPGLRQRVTRAVSDGLQDSGVDVVPPPADPSPSAIAKAVADLAGSTFVMKGTVEAEGRSYTFRLELLDAKSGAMLASREDRCEICTEAEALETANTAASTLKTQAFSRPSGANGTPPAGAGAAAGAAASGGAGVASNPRVRVVVAEALDLPPSLDEFHGKIRAAIETLIHDAGLGLAVPPPGSAARCTTRDCLKELALTVGATDVLAVAGSRNEVQGFALELELWNAARDEGAKSQGWCNFCTGPQMVTAAEDLGRPLLAQLAGREGVVTSAGVAPGATVPAATDEGGGGISRSRVLLGTGLFAAGAAAVVVGGITWHRAGEITDCMDSGGKQVCTGEYGGKTAGISLAVGGVVAAVVGGWLFVEGVTYHGPQVAIGPNSVAISGSF